MECDNKKNINSIIEKRIEKEIEKIIQKNENLRENMQKFYQDSFEKLTNNLIDNLQNFGKEIKEEFSFLSQFEEKNTNLENNIKDLKQTLIQKNNEIIEFEIEKKNWNKVSYTKFLDKQLQEKIKDLEIMNLKFSHVSKQNQILKDKLIEKSKEIKDICISNNIDLRLGDEISLSGSIPEDSILDNNEDGLEMNIKMFIKDKEENNIENNEYCEIETQENEIETQENEIETQENDKQQLDNVKNEIETQENEIETQKNDKQQLDNVKNEIENDDISEISSEYEVYEYQNKKGEKKKYLKRKKNNKIYLFKYSLNKEKIGDAIGEIRKKNDIEKPSFYRKKN